MAEEVKVDEVKQTAKKTSGTKTKTTTKKATTKETKTNEPKQRERLVLDNNVILNVQSTTFGKLVYVNTQTGDKVVWEHENEIQQVTAGNLREMKSRQPGFFKNYWIRIIGIEDIDETYQDRTIEEIYKALTLQQYYENSMMDIEDLILNHTDEIPTYLNKMGKSFKTSLIIRCNDMIESGKLDAFSKIKKMEEILGTELGGED
ncbi:hypothetical protein [Faecalibacillus intestinalis]|jgi:hypothetical protein|uniref:hypothetical protein n=1 Tax=Faecalibacillus intestinalis TaxID=1982626 RepID=UPI0022E13BB3|nr:hypothetical protein [Faecalibacillus intestinalis]